MQHFEILPKSILFGMFWFRDIWDGDRETTDGGRESPGITGGGGGGLYFESHGTDIFCSSKSGGSDILSSSKSGGGFSTPITLATRNCV